MRFVGRLALPRISAFYHPRRSVLPTSTGLSTIPGPENASEPPTWLPSRTGPSEAFLARFAARYVRGKQAGSGLGSTLPWFRARGESGWGVCGKLGKMLAVSQPGVNRMFGSTAATGKAGR